MAVIFLLHHGVAIDHDSVKSVHFAADMNANSVISYVAQQVKSANHDEQAENKADKV